MLWWFPAHEPTAFKKQRVSKLTAYKELIDNTISELQHNIKKK